MPVIGGSMHLCIQNKGFNVDYLRRFCVAILQKLPGSYA